MEKSAMTAISETRGPILEPTTRAFIDALEAQGGKPIYRLSVPEARQVLEKLQSQPIDKTPAQEEELTIPAGPNGRLSLRIVKPMNVAGDVPVIMYFHGGGWILGSKDTHDRLVREIAAGVSAAVVFVNYTPSPEAKYPIPIEEAYAATRYVAENGPELNLDSSRLALAGDSVGGNMAAAVAILAKQRKGPEIAFQALFYPVTAASFDSASYREFENGPWLTKKAMEWFWEAYAPDEAVRAEVSVSPLRASVRELEGLPPALVITDENDVLRDEGEAYARKLLQAGVRVTATRYLGTTHDFMMLNPLARTPATRAAIAQATGMLRSALGVPSEMLLAA